MRDFFHGNCAEWDVKLHHCPSGPSCWGESWVSGAERTFESVS